MVKSAYRIFQRKGLRWGDLNEIQRTALFDMIKATLSEEGVKQVIENMDGDEVLKMVPLRGAKDAAAARSAGRGPGRLIFGKDEYYISILVHLRRLNLGCGSSVAITLL